MNDMIPGGYLELLTEIKQRIRSAQYEALKAVNKELIALYWDIGRIIQERQKEHSWGKAVVEHLADDLHKEFPGIQGFSARNIWYMRDFYITYFENKKLQPLVAEISWTKHLIIMAQCKDDLEREFYITATKKFGWTKNVLLHQIENKSYEKYLLNQTNFDRTVPDSIKNQAKLAVKDHYTFDFLELSDEHSEYQLEEIEAELRDFLLCSGLKNHRDHREHREKRQNSVFSECWYENKINNELARTKYELTLPEFVSVRLGSLFFSCSFVNQRFIADSVVEKPGSNSLFQEKLRSLGIEWR